MAPQSYEYYKLSLPSPFVAHVEINRPKKLNSFIEPMWLELRTLFNSLSHDPSVRAIVLSGAGPKAFTTGLDTMAAADSAPLSQKSSGAELDVARKATLNRRHIDEFQACVSSVETCEKPVICVMHGYCLGLAIDLSCATDVRIASKDAKFCVKEVDIGLAADIGTLTRLPKVVGSMSWVKEVCLSARMFGAVEAERVGFVSEVCEGKEKAVERALQLARTMAEKSPVAVQGTKELMNFSVDHTVAEGLRYTSVWNMAMLQTQDIPASMVGQIEKKKPRFEKL